MAVPPRSRAPRTPQAGDAEPSSSDTKKVRASPPASRKRAAPKAAADEVKKAPRPSAKPAAPAQPSASVFDAGSTFDAKAFAPFQDMAKQAMEQAEQAMQKGMPGLDLSALKALNAMKLPGMPAEALKQWLGQAGQPAASAMAPLKQAAQAMGQSLGATMQSMAGLTLPPGELQHIQQDYMQQATALWNHALDKPVDLKTKDRRFASPEWSANPASAFMASMYLLNANTLRRLADSLQGDEKARERVRFAVQQWADAASPSNFLALNPEALKKAVETKGSSITQGVQHLLHDLRQGHMSQTDESVFHVGQNVATTAGSVVYENDYFQLIEYAPLTSKVHEVPFLFVPPCINKFYILDLQPDNSLVRYALLQGHRVFMVSWVNADESLAKATWDDYVEHGVMQAIETTREITGVDQINALGFCVGGTLLATALAALAARGEKPVASLTLLTTFLDFANTGTMDIFVDEAMVRMREMTMGPDSPQGGGLMKGGDLAATFSFLRANDLVWNYVVGNYLKGEMPPAFDLLYWNSDSTNLPGPMYSWYLRNTYLENKLVQPGAVTVCGEPLDLSLIDVPTFIYGSREDHIVPWDGAYASTRVVSGPKTFVLGASGHIAGVINPPEKKKRNYWTNTKLAQRLPEQAQDWLATAQEHPGSWWPVWAEWLGKQAGDMVAAPKQAGDRRHPPIEAAPGRYVLRKA